MRRVRSSSSRSYRRQDTAPVGGGDHRPGPRPVRHIGSEGAVDLHPSCTPRYADGQGCHSPTAGRASSQAELPVGVGVPVHTYPGISFGPSEEPHLQPTLLDRRQVAKQAAKREIGRQELLDKLFAAQSVGLEQYGIELAGEVLAEQLEFGTTGIGVDSHSASLQQEGDGRLVTDRLSGFGTIKGGGGLVARCSAELLPLGRN